MDLKKYFDIDLKTTLLFTVLGIIAGYISFAVKNNIASLVIMLALLFAGRFLFQHIVKEKKEWKWWLGNGMVVYIFVWFIVWTIFYNIWV